MFRRERGGVTPTDETIRIWCKKNRCGSKARTTDLPDKTDDGTRISRTEYTDCASRGRVVLYRIEGGGHTWPGGRQYLPVRLVGSVSRDLMAPIGASVPDADKSSRRTGLQSGYGHALSAYWQMGYGI